MTVLQRTYDAAEELGFDARRLARIDAAMQRLVEQREAAGIVTLVARRGKVVHFNTFGHANLHTQTPMRHDAIFRIASMSKPVTAAAVMLLFEEGHFLLDDPISNFIPEFANTRVFPDRGLERPISIRHLLTHTSGIAYPSTVVASIVGPIYDATLIMRRDEPLADKIARLATLPLAHQPGEAWTYGMSIDVLGRLVELVSGQPFDVFLRTRLFEPLGMADTDFSVAPEELDRLAAVYTQDLELPEQQLLSEPAERPVFLMGGGGLVSTAADYARFASMLACGGTLDGIRVLGPKTVELMLMSQMPEDQVPFVPPDWGFRNGYAMALGVRTLVNLAAAGLPGSLGSVTWQGAYSTDFWVDPREQLVGVVMLQRAPCWFRPGELLRLLTYQALV